MRVIRSEDWNMTMLYTNFGDTPAIHASECDGHTPDGDETLIACTKCGSVWNEADGAYYAPRYLTLAEFREAFAPDTANYCAGRW
jgi:hypothetical protein